MHSHRKKAAQNAPLTCLAEFYGNALSKNLISAKVLARDKSHLDKRDGKTQFTSRPLSKTRAAPHSGLSVHGKLLAM
ncbi:MAG: hypothetical protein LBV73_12710 [Paraburkholderia sp.]|jgi:IS5 family transposase|nr:hypothetical protein [Paraburkholderia sp.]